MKSILRLVSFVAFMAAAQIASAQVTLTFTATANTDAAGYTVAHGPYTFTFTLTSNFASTYNTFTGSSNLWQEDLAGPDTQLYTAITGTGVTGTFTQPSGGAPYSFLQNTSGSFLSLYAGTESALKPTGLQSLDGTDINLAAHGTLSSVDFLFSGSETQPAAYFADYTGSYALSGSPVISLTDLNNNTLLTFTATNVTIGSGAIPEPATYAMLAGLGALGLALWRRRSRR
ncbi:MAG: PEP-CTERM sorting domain-containing protein [Verrucomicrobia bacterium]|nr:PEP-CTERM sorting domain-containing protein [Verrucomicrobiota bacterium]